MLSARCLRFAVELIMVKLLVCSWLIYIALLLMMMAVSVFFTSSRWRW